MSEKTIEWTTRDVDSAKMVLSKTPEESENLPTLTDEEVVALDGIDREQFVALPFLDENNEQRKLACNVALRGLMAKALAFPVVAEGDETPTGLNAVEDITGIMTLRRTSQRIVSAERTAANGKYWLYGYLHDATVLEEIVSDGGIHEFSVYPVAALADRLVTLADPHSAAAGDGQGREFTESQFETQAPDVLGDTRAVTAVTGIGVESQTLSNVTVYTGLDSVHCLHADAAGALSVADPETSGAPEPVLRIAPVSAETLRRELDAVVIGQEPAQQ